MARHSQRLSYGLPSREHKDFVLLEQEPWDNPYIGYLTKFAVYAYIKSIVFDEDPPEENCALPVVHGNVFAYPSREDLRYIIGASWGSLSERRVEEAEYVEEIQCNLEKDLSLTYPAQSIVGVAWVGDVYTAEGEIVNPKPTATVTTDGATLPIKVYGTLLITYMVCRHVYELSIDPRPTSDQNKLQSFVFACWDGGNTYMEMEAQNGAEGGECNYKVDYNLHMPDDDEPPDHVDPEDSYKDMDYCSGLELVGL